MLVKTEFIKKKKTEFISILDHINILLLPHRKLV